MVSFGATSCHIRALRSVLSRLAWKPGFCISLDLLPRAIFSWGNFDGLSGQFCFLSIALCLAVVDAAAFAIAYDVERRDMVHRLASGATLRLALLR